jgi:ferrous iron transport protein A
MEITPVESPYTSRTLRDMRPGQSALVTRILSSNQLLTSKLLAMGIVAGCKVQVIAESPFGDPIEISARGYRLSLRRAEASCICVMR